MKKAKGKKILKVIAGVVSLGVVASISFGATLAYLSARTDVKRNVFTSGGIDIDLVEPDFSTLMQHEYKPGDKIPKNPHITLSENSDDAYVAMALQFYTSIDAKTYNENKTDKDYIHTKENGVDKYYKQQTEDYMLRYVIESLDGLTIDNYKLKDNAGIWEKGTVPDGSKAVVFYYTESANNNFKLLKKDTTTKTENLFNKVEFKKDSNVMSNFNPNADKEKLTSSTIPDVKIVVTAYGVKANTYKDSSNVQETVKKALDGLIKGNLPTLKNVVES